MSKTRSEMLFERFCQRNSIQFSCIPPNNIKKAPDYDFFPAGEKVAAEVKELTPNEDDAAFWKEVRAGKGVVFRWCDPSNRIRRKIARAAKQLKARTNGEYPGIAVLYDNGANGTIDGTDIKNCH